jgi:hypothetical protein
MYDVVEQPAASTRSAGIEGLIPVYTTSPEAGHASPDEADGSPATDVSSDSEG